MAFQPTTAKPGDLIEAAHWNAAMQEIVRLGQELEKQKPGDGTGSSTGKADSQPAGKAGGETGAGPSGEKWAKESDLVQLRDQLAEMFGKLRPTPAMDMKPGPLPVTSQPFQTKGGTLLLFVSGTGYNDQGCQIGVNVTLAGSVRGQLKSYSNERRSHKAFCSNTLVVAGVPAGSHTITLSPWGPTLSDYNDFYSITVIELPV